MQPVLAVVMWSLMEISAPQGAEIYTTTLTISTYPYANYLYTQYSYEYNMTYPCLNWGAYNAPGQHPSPQDYTALVMENEWLRLTVLPELGGRLYGITVKATGEELLYQNPVIKPTHWGPVEQGWWLAVGGVEWCMPVDEHGYEWGIPWEYEAHVSGDGATVTLWDSTADSRIRTRITIHLAAGRAAIQVSPRLENPTGSSVTFKFWDNAMLAPGSSNSVGPELRFVLPTDQVTVHSRGDGFLPGPGQPMDWPVHSGVNYARLGNWNRWLGVFVRPQAVHDWAGVYDEGTLQGVARVYPHEVAVGVKGFGMGWNDPLNPEIWTDDGSTYVELHGGPSPTFWDSITLAAGQSLEWTETWVPVRSLPELSLATEDVVLGIQAAGPDLHLGFLVSSPREDLSARLWCKSECTLLWRQDNLSLSAGEPFTHLLPGLGLGAEHVAFAVLEGDSLLAATGIPDCPPLDTWVEALDPVQTTEEFAVGWSGLDVEQGLASYDVLVREGEPDASWSLWLSGTTESTALYSGQDGQTYTFRSQARDIFGNEEALPGGEWDDTFTTVLLEPAPVLITSRKVAEPLSVLPGDEVNFEILLNNTGNLGASVQVTDPIPIDLELIGDPYSSQPPDPVVVGDTILWSGTVEAGQTDVAIGFDALVAQVPVGGVITNGAWIDDGIHPVLYRSASVRAHWFVHLPLVLKQ